MKVLLFFFHAVLACAVTHASSLLEDVNNAPKDSDVGINMVNLVKKRGFDIETHYVTTSDGYILTVFRIPGPKGAAPVLLQHGLLDSSYTWIANFADESMGYILANSGFDVWMGNNRGNHYGRNHTTLDPDSAEKNNPFWQFTYDEMARYDAPAMIEYVLEQTGKPSMGWVGHSEGTMQFFAGASQKYPAFSKINLFVGLAPIGSISNLKSRELVALAHTSFTEDLIKAGLQEFFPLGHTSASENFVNSAVCRATPHMCVALLDSLAGPSLNLNATRLQVYVSQTPAGTSAINMDHFVQGIVDKSGIFKMYDWGSAEANAAKYNGATEPPIYDLTQYAVPSALFSGEHDWMADPKDVQKLFDLIPAEYIKYSQVDSFAHLDYTWAPSAADKVYKPAAKLLQQYAAK